ncbi:MAG: hypothetical protein AB7V11_17190 [Pyrinomonadaceae bacterium]
MTCLIGEMERAIETIEAVDDLSFVRSTNTGSLGQQFRHDLDFVVSLLKGIAVGRIDYNDRERATRIETDRRTACAMYREVIGQLEAIDRCDLLKSVTVRSELDPDQWLPSCVGREIDFVHSHTVHHHALIAEKLRTLGIKVSADLGLAPSTKRFRSAEAA